MTGWFLKNSDGSFAKSIKTGTEIWFPSEKRALEACDNGYGDEGAEPIELEMVSNPSGYNGWKPIMENKMNIIKSIIREEIKKMYR